MPRTSGGAAAGHGQLDLFSQNGDTTDGKLLAEPASATGAAEQWNSQVVYPIENPKRSTPRAPHRSTGQTASTRDRRLNQEPRAEPERGREFRVVALNEMPRYPPELVTAVMKSIKEAPTERVLLTYKEIDAFFGVSRATVARRLKDGKIPGIRLKHGRVLEDGPVRRLDRTQLLYLLLAVRSGRT